MSNKKILMAFSAVFVLLCAAFGILYLNRDAQPPVIAFPEGDAVYTGDESTLLEGVFASDNQDGDVSGSLRVDSVISNGETVRVKYAAKDSSGNVAEKVRVMKPGAGVKADAAPRPQATPTPSPVPSPTPVPNPKAPVIRLVSDSVTIGADEDYYIIEFVESVEDDHDSPEVLYQSIDVLGEYDLTVPGTYPVEFVVTDSDGNQSEPAPLTINVQ